MASQASEYRTGKSQILWDKRQKRIFIVKPQFFSGSGWFPYQMSVVFCLGDEYRCCPSIKISGNILGQKSTPHDNAGMVNSQAKRNG